MVIVPPLPLPAVPSQKTPQPTMAALFTMTSPPRPLRTAPFWKTVRTGVAVSTTIYPLRLQPTAPFQETAQPTMAALSATRTPHLLSPTALFQEIQQPAAEVGFVTRSPLPPPSRTPFSGITRHLIALKYTMMDPPLPLSPTVISRGNMRG